MVSTPATVPSAFSITSATSLSTRSGLAPGYTVTTMRYGVLISGSRLVCMWLRATKPSSSTMTTPTRTVNGFLTLNFSISSYHFSCSPLRVRRSKYFPLYSYYTQGGGACKGRPCFFRGNVVKYPFDYGILKQRMDQQALFAARFKRYKKQQSRECYEKSHFGPF